MLQPKYMELQVMTGFRLLFTSWNTAYACRFVEPSWQSRSIGAWVGLAPKVTYEWYYICLSGIGQHHNIFQWTFMVLALGMYGALRSLPYGPVRGASSHELKSNRVLGNGR
jgi:hypothetical protein